MINLTDIKDLDEYIDLYVKEYESLAPPLPEYLERLYWIEKIDPQKILIMIEKFIFMITSILAFPILVRNNLIDQFFESFFKQYPRYDKSCPLFFYYEIYLNALIEKDFLKLTASINSPNKFIGLANIIGIVESQGIEVAKEIINFESSKPRIFLNGYITAMEKLNDTIN